MSIADFLEDELLELVFNGGGYAGQSIVYVKLHLGDPGENCTANAAAETDRQAMTCTGGAVAGTITNDADLDWLGVAATETFSHVSLWDDPTAGNALWSGPLDAPVPMLLGGDFSLLAGEINVALA